MDRGQAAGVGEPQQVAIRLMVPTRLPEPNDLVALCDSGTWSDSPDSRLGFPRAPALAAAARRLQRWCAAGVG
jgi:hypothetical protein